MENLPTGYGAASTLDAATEQKIAAELRRRQSRLGTHRERPDDYGRICDLAHLLNNFKTIAALTAELKTVGRDSPG
jgi:hypothetical protein